MCFVFRKEFRVDKEHSYLIWTFHHWLSFHDNVCPRQSKDEGEMLTATKCWSTQMVWRPTTIVVKISCSYFSCIDQTKREAALYRLSQKAGPATIVVGGPLPLLPINTPATCSSGKYHSNIQLDICINKETFPKGRAGNNSIVVGGLLANTLPPTLYS